MAAKSIDQKYKASDMNNHRVDKAFHKLNSHHSEIDAGNVWDRLEPLLEPKKNDRKWLLFLLPMLALVFFVLLVMVKFPENNTKSEVKSTAGKTNDVKTEQNLIISSDKLNVENEQHYDVSNTQVSNLDAQLNTIAESTLEKHVRTILKEDVSEFIQQDFIKNVRNVDLQTI